ncbi:hypothetical protein [Streptomyces californicus]|uniref:hypothetical protein n=1 Tax=Streptomyces californicus TaxID=67351 RepID=UPI00378B8289
MTTPAETLRSFLRARARIAARHPEFAHAPEGWGEPNETSRTYFRELNPPQG